MKVKAKDFAYVGMSAALLAVCSWISIPLPSGVPVTLQTFGVCLVAAVFGRKKGVASTLIYILIGIIGIPVFSGFRSGIGMIVGNTGGYLVGFVITSLIVGAASDYADKKSFKSVSKYIFISLSMLVGIIACYAFGTAWFAVLWARSNEPAALMTILGWCVLPYIIPDIVKIAFAVTVFIPVKRAVKKI